MKFFALILLALTVTASAELNVKPGVEPNVKPTFEPNVKPDTEPNVKPDVEPNVFAVGSFEEVVDDEGNTVTVYRDGAKFGTATLEKQVAKYNGKKNLGFLEDAAKFAPRTWIKAKQLEKHASAIKADAVTWNAQKVVTKIDRFKIKEAVRAYRRALKAAKAATRVRAETEEATNYSKNMGSEIEKNCQGNIDWLVSLYEDQITFDVDGKNVNVE